MPLSMPLNLHNFMKSIYAKVATVFIGLSIIALLSYQISVSQSNIKDIESKNNNILWRITTPLIVFNITVLEDNQCIKDDLIYNHCLTPQWIVGYKNDNYHWPEWVQDGARCIGNTYQEALLDCWTKEPTGMLYIDKSDGSPHSNQIEPESTFQDTTNSNLCIAAIVLQSIVTCCIFFLFSGFQQVRKCQDCNEVLIVILLSLFWPVFILFCCYSWAEEEPPEVEWWCDGTCV